MFEAVISLCLSLADGPCRDHLLPGYEAQTAAACGKELAARPPVVPDLGLAARGEARCTAIGETLDMQEVAEGIYVHTGAIAVPDEANRGDVSNLGFIVGEQAVVLIDSGSARWIGEATWRAVRARTTLPVSHVILTHQHPDHVLGAAVFEEAGAEIVGHAKLPRALADRQDNYIASLARLIGLPDFLGTRSVNIGRVVEEHFEIDLGGRNLTLLAHPTAHTGTDLTVSDSLTGIMFVGDLLFDGHTPALDGSLPGWRALLEQLQALGIAGVVPGHGRPVLDWPEGLEDTARYLDVLERDTREAIDERMRLGEAVDVIASEEQTRWQLFDEYNPRNATVAFTELEWE